MNFSGNSKRKLFTDADHPKRRHPSYLTIFSIYLFGLLVLVFLLSTLAAVGMYAFEVQYKGKIYPNVTIDGIPFAGQTKEDVIAYVRKKNKPLEQAQFQFWAENAVATVSGTELSIGFDEEITAKQALLVGRTGKFFSDLTAKFLTPTIAITPYFRWKDEILNETLENLGARISVPVEDALFQFSNGKVTSFRPSKDGKKLNITDTRLKLKDIMKNIPDNNDGIIKISAIIDTIKPNFSTDQVNSIGIKEKIGTGYSQFSGSIPGRIHNVALAASKLNGVLIKPGETFSINNTLGDISAATGYQPAYIIKEGKTVLGDGGGVCQISSTVFRAALNTGLPIVERHGHAYRVHYYEDGGFKPGLDATIFSPTVDLKFTNDTGQYILIQTHTDTQKLNLTVDFYGTHDGRSVEIYDHKVWGESPPPPPLYQDDPTLPAGIVKQVDFSAWGAKASFKYRVIRGGEKLIDTEFTTNYRPWQAVFLRGIK